MKSKLLSFFLLTTISGFSQNFILDENSGILPVQRNWDEVYFQDIDGDGYIDLYTGGAASNYATFGRMYKNDGTGHFILDDDETFIKKREGGLAFGDVNGDGFPDMIVSGGFGNPGPGGSQVGLYLNDGEGNFTENTSNSFVAAREGDIRMFDFDNDGDLDIIISGFVGSNNYALHLYQNDGTGNFTLNTQSGLETFGLYHGYVEIADLDNDGFLDIATVGQVSTGASLSKIRIFRNNGNSTFTLMNQAIFNHTAKGAIKAGDIDNNDTIDLVFIGNGPASSSTIIGFNSAVFLNDGNANFTKAVNTPFIRHTDFPSIALADFDNDGFLDVITMGRVIQSPNTHAIHFYLNNGEGNFIEVEDIPFTAHNYGKLTVGDVNNDGYNDLLITGLGDNNTAVAKLFINNIGVLNVDNKESFKFKIYPNPVQDILNIEPFSNDILKSFEIYGIDGSLIKQNLIYSNSSIDVSSLSSGVYILSITTEEGNVNRIKFIKK